MRRMGWRPTRKGRFNGTRFSTVTPVGIALAVSTVVLLLSAGATAGVAPVVVLGAPYTGTVSSPTYSNFVNGCASGKVTALPKWSATTGAVTTGDFGAAKPCPKSVSGTGAYSTGQGSSGVQFAVPFKVSSNGNHGITSNWTFTLTTSVSSTVGGCPAKKINYFPPLYASDRGQCSDGTFVFFNVNSYLVDLNNASWYQYNSSIVLIYNESGWENYTSCYNYGTPSCYNFTGPFGYAWNSQYNVVGFAGFKWTGTTTATFWTNGTAMKSGHRYALVVNLSFFAESFAIAYGLAKPWSASAVASLNMATLGNGATLNSITIT